MLTKQRYFCTQSSGKTCRRNHPARGLMPLQLKVHSATFSSIDLHHVDSSILYILYTDHFCYIKSSQVFDCSAEVFAFLNRVY